MNRAACKMESSRGCRGKRSFTLAEVIRKLDESDQEVCGDSDTDRDSSYQMSDVEGDSDVVSHVLNLSGRASQTSLMLLQTQATAGLMYSKTLHLPVLIQNGFQ